jgi:hypothetical protein
MLPAKLAISYMNIFTFLIKRNIKVLGEWLPCQGFPPPFHTQVTVTKSCVCQDKTMGPVKWQVLFFLPRVAGPGLILPGLSNFWYFFCNKSKMHHFEKSWRKTYRENTFQGLQFFSKSLCLRDFEQEALKKDRSYMTWAVEDRVKIILLECSLIQFFSCFTFPLRSSIHTLLTGIKVFQLYSIYLWHKNSMYFKMKLWNYW